MNQENKSQFEYDEINLMDYIRIIIKRKCLILGFLLAGLIISGGLTFLLPINYKTETCLEIGNYSKEYSKEGVLYLYPIENTLQVMEKIKGGFYGDYLGAETSNPPKTSLVKIEIISEDLEGTKKTLENINRSILEEHNNRIEAKKEILENSIEKLQEKIDFLLAKNKEVETLELEICNIQRQIGDVQPSRIIKEPAVVSEKKPNLTFNLICGGILGIFLGVFLAFGKEWWEKNKSRI